ncbi:MAG TPA: MDR family MFS transporter [Rectinemataceae bacterium]|nr:MDR family MFS transporter [Rectinemataceae bacterium]
MDFQESGSAPAKAAPEAGAGPRLRGAALFSVMLGLFLTLFLEALDQTVVGTALPKIVGSLSGFDRYVWTVTAYILMSTVSVPIAGKLSDQFGRKGFLLCGTVLFLAGSALSGISRSMDMLILSRALQGLGAGTGIALAPVVIADLFPPRERVKWQSFFGLIYGVSSLVGPTLGGLIADHGPLLGALVTPATRWRWIFYLNLPLGAAALGMLGVALPARHVAGRRFRGLKDLRRVDFAGALLLAAATTGLLLGLTWASSGRHDWTSNVVLGDFAAAALLGILFFVAERRAVEPILPLDLFRNPIFASAAVVSLLQMMILVGLIIYLPFFLQVVLGVSATGSGAAITPMNLASVLGAAVGGGLFMGLKRHRPITITASLILCGGTFLMATMSGNTRVLLAVLFMALAGLGIGPFFSILTVITQNALPQDRLGIGTSVLRYMGQLGSVLGAALVGTVVNGALTARLGPALAVRRGFATLFIVSLAMLAATLLMRERRMTGPSKGEALG